MNQATIYTLTSRLTVHSHIRIKSSWQYLDSHVVLEMYHHRHQASLTFWIHICMYDCNVTVRLEKQGQQQLLIIMTKALLCSPASLAELNKKRTQLHHRGKLRKAQLYANVLWRSVSNSQTRANRNHIDPMETEAPSCLILPLYCIKTCQTKRRKI